MFIQSLLIIATVGSVSAFCMMTGIDTSIAKVMVGLAVALVISLVVTGHWDHPYVVPLSEI
jgi:hypothetical protein